MYSLAKHRIQVLIKINKIVNKLLRVIISILTRHFWWYIYHTTRPHKLSTSREDGPKDFKYHFVKQLKSYRKRVVKDSDI